MSLETDRPLAPKRHRVVLNVEVHPEIRKGLAMAALREDLTQVEWLHRALCPILGREDLLDHPPPLPSIRRGRLAVQRPVEAT